MDLVEVVSQEIQQVEDLEVTGNRPFAGQGFPILKRKVGWEVRRNTEYDKGPETSVLRVT